MKFKDYFSEVAESYAQTRFIYPPEIFAWLAKMTPDLKLAWDCGTGNGQAAIGLAEHFERVVATDASTDQIAHARSHSRIEYKVALAKESGLADTSVALVTSFLAAHWFDQKAFFAEVHRVIVDQGLCALWCYDVPKVSADIDPILEEFYFETIKPWAPPERALIDTRYRDFEFPFEEIEPPPFSSETRWTLKQLMALVRTWSAVRRYQTDCGQDPLLPLAERLIPYWGEGKRSLTWHLYGRVGYCCRFPTSNAKRKNPD